MYSDVLNRHICTIGFKHILPSIQIKLRDRLVITSHRRVRQEIQQSQDARVVGLRDACIMVLFGNSSQAGCVGHSRFTFEFDFVSKQTSHFSLSTKEAEALNFIEESGSASNKEVAHAIGLSTSGSLKLLRRLAEKGLIESRGGGRSTSYVIVSLSDF